MKYLPKMKTYRGEGINVTYDIKRCIHAAECVRGIPEVFDTSKRPWVSPDNAPADLVAEVVLRCPTGALHFDRQDDGPPEPTPERNIVFITENGPLYIRGDIKITNPDGSFLLEDTRLAFCRCGSSRYKPFCDNSHWKIGFKAGGSALAAHREVDDWEPGGQIHVTPSTGGPYLLAGFFEILDSNGGLVFRGSQAELCRCGGSQNKPFCDNTHKVIGFTSG